MKALVTGATGFIGSHLVEALLARGDEVRCLVRSPLKLRWLEAERPRIRIIEGDIAEAAAVRGAAAGADCVYHLAALTRAPRPQELFRVNAEGTRRLVQACLEEASPPRRLVYLSSLAAAGPARDRAPLIEEAAPGPVSAYGWSKLAGEKEVLAAREGTHVTVLRPAIVCGPRDQGLVRYALWVKRGWLPVPRGFAGSLNFLYVDDLVRALVAVAAGEQPSGGVYHVASDRVLTWEGVGGALGASMAVRPRPLRLPLSMLMSLAACSEAWSWATRCPTFFTREKVREAAGDWVCSSAKAKRDLGFMPSVSPEEGIAKAIRWYREEGWI